MSFINNMTEFIKEIFFYRRLIADLTKRDFKERFVSSYLGILWAFIQPLVNVIVFWFVFEVGFKIKPTSTGLPYILWLITGLFPWYFFSEALVGTTSSITSKSFLVKKIVFPVRILPVIQIVSALIVNIFFIILLILSFGIYGYTFNLYNLQIIYYSFASICLVLGLSWITSSMSVFVRDLVPFINMSLQLLFWITPIFWEVSFIPARYHSILSLNPLSYIVNGYRNSFINYRWFWYDTYETIYFWSVTIAIMFVGTYIFNKLKPHFADVL